MNVMEQLQETAKDLEAHGLLSDTPSDDHALTAAYMSGFADGKRAARPEPIATLHIVDGQLVGTNRSTAEPIPTGTYVMYRLEDAADS